MLVGFACVVTLPFICLPILHFLWGKWDRDGRHELMYCILRFILHTNAIGESIKIDMMRQEQTSGWDTIEFNSSEPDQCATVHMA